jgi:2-methylfumaryl-CoA hydratase
VTAWSEVLDKAEVDVPGAGALRLRLVAARAGSSPGPVRGADGRYSEGVLLDLDIWALHPQ